MSFKVTIIGGGSSSFVPILLRRLIQSGPLGDSTVTLMDIDERRLGVMQELGDRLVAGEDSPLTVRSTLDQRESLRGADFVIAAISVGGFDAWAQDLEIPGRYGLVMHVADSVGPGGIMRALRNAPVLAEVAQTVADVAPDAHVFNYTNPAPTEALAMLTAAPSVKSYALCSCTGHPSSAEWLAEQAGVAAAEIAMPPVVAGLNHCAAVTELRLRDGTDAMPLVREHATNPIVRWALETYGVLPYCWSHWVEHFPQMQRLEGEYAGSAQGVAMRYGITTHDMSSRILYAALTVALVAALALEMAVTDTSWWLVVAFLLGPDVALLAGIGTGLEKGQLHPRAVPLYNALHRYWGPAALALASLVLPEGWLAAALAWAVHVSLDRAIGYGLRTPEGFQRT